MLYVGVCCAVVSVPCSLVVLWSVTCWERTDLLAVVFVVFCHFHKSVLVHIRIKGEVGAMKFKPFSKIFLMTVPRRYFFCGSFVLFMSCVCHAFASVHCCLVVTCWERVDLLALVCDVYCVFVTFPCVNLAQVWYLIVSIPDICHLSYYE